MHAMQRGTLEHLRQAAERLQGTERQVVLTVLEDPAVLPSASIDDFAEKCGVSVSSVVRACKRLGFSGFRQLKMAVAYDLASATAVEMPKLMGRVERGDSPQEVIQKVFKATQRSMRQSLQHLSVDGFEAALDAIEKANLVAVFSSGTDAFMVEHCTSKFVLANVNCIGSSDHVQQMMLVTVMNPGDVVLFFNHQGLVRAQVQIVEEAKARGITTIAVTNFPQSPLARASDICLATAVQDDDFYLRAMGSQVARMVVVDALLVALGLRREEIVIPNFKELRRALKNIQM